MIEITRKRPKMFIQQGFIFFIFLCPSSSITLPFLVEESRVVWGPLVVSGFRRVDNKALFPFWWVAEATMGSQALAWEVVWQLFPEPFLLVFVPTLEEVWKGLRTEMLWWVEKL